MFAKSSRLSISSVFKVYTSTLWLLTRQFKPLILSTFFWLVMMAIFITPIGMLLTRLGIGFPDLSFDWFLPIANLLKGLVFAAFTSGIFLASETIMKGEKMKLRQLFLPIFDLSILKRIAPLSIVLAILFFLISWSATMDFDYRDLLQRRSELEPWTFRWLISVPILFPLMFNLPILLNELLTPLAGSFQWGASSEHGPFNQVALLLSLSLSLLLPLALSVVLGLVVSGKQSTLSALSQTLRALTRNWIFVGGSWILLVGFSALIVFVSAWFSILMILIAPYQGYFWYRSLSAGSQD